MRIPGVPQWNLNQVNVGFNASEGLVEGINLKIFTGERIAIISENSRERGILLRLLGGLRPFRSGSFEIFGTNLQMLSVFADWDQIMPDHLRKRLGVCLENEGLLNNVSIREGLELLYRFKFGDRTHEERLKAQKVVGQICSDFGLGSAIEKRPFLLSGAEKRLAGLARAFLSEPEAVLLENPSQNIGDSFKPMLRNAIAKICEDTNRTVILSTDDWVLASRVCPRWIVVEDSRIFFDGDQKEFLRSRHRILRQIEVLKDAKLMYEQLTKDVA